MGKLGFIRNHSWKTSTQNRLSAYGKAGWIHGTIVKSSISLTNLKHEFRVEKGRKGGTITIIEASLTETVR